MVAARLLFLSVVTAAAAAAPAAAPSSFDAEFIARRNAEEPYATFSTEGFEPDYHRGGCYKAPSHEQQLAASAAAPFNLTEEELFAAASGAVSVDWREHGAVGPVQQQHPFGTCWAFSMTAVTEAVSVIQGRNKFEKLSEQQTVSCTPPTATGDNSDVLWSWALRHTGGRYQTEAQYPYNRTCNSFRETQLAPDGKPDGYVQKCDFKHPSKAGPCPPCDSSCRADGTPPCRLKDMRKGPFSKARVRGWGFIAPHGRRRRRLLLDRNGRVDSPDDVTRMVAALVKYGPAQIGIDASCLSGYKAGIVTNCTRTVQDQDHAVAIVGAGTAVVEGGNKSIDYWLVRNSWSASFGEGGYFRMARDTMQMGIFGGYFACYSNDCRVDPE